MAVGGKFAAQGFGQLVVTKASHGYGPHLRYVQMPVSSHSQGAVHLEVAAPQAQHHPVARRDDGGILGVLCGILALRKIALKQVGSVRLGCIFGLDRAGQGEKDQQKSENSSVRHGSVDAMDSGLHGPQRWFRKQAVGPRVP